MISVGVSGVNWWSVCPSGRNIPLRVRSGEREETFGGAEAVFGMIAGGISFALFRRAGGVFCVLLIRVDLLFGGHMIFLLS